MIRGAFSIETLNNVQVLISIVINLTITCLCGIVVYYSLRKYEGGGRLK